ncbi:hypothetical protein K490DRAFT_53861 [Saccharata proteae CBS 121410]|uniref:SP-RING-type domain-containing protein n=1 Tax=Saccharata proteae CBS 121410 TaxID=1314787 RepID=A0A9P4HZX7_9PEZI|nr:hypothetical protein K490DRAFT_53861 [Saccharata proteae CBS 121410]
MSPRQIDCENPMQTFEFNVSGVEFARIARSEHPKLGQVPTVFVDETAITYRLRCARSPTSDESRWLLADNVWPEGLFLEINSCDVEFRRKLHHGKDLPVDLTPHIREGSNELKLAVVRTDMKTALAGWALAVEMVGLATQETIKQDCLQNRIIPADTIKSGITNHLNAVDSGDEIMIVNDSITINLVDPFSGCLICEIPVRGVDCPHREAFDLDVFLMTRPRKKPNAASFVDVWKCPICKGDARPKCLIVDGFLLEVRAKLAEQGLLNKTRSIIFEKDGSWKPMAEEDDDQQGESANSEKQPQAFKSPPTGVQPVVDIIDLDSD